MPIEPGKFKEAVAIAARGVALNVITDDPAVPAALDDTAGRANVRLGVFLKVDTGYHRCGVLPDSTEALTIPLAIGSSANLDFAGILTHAGHSYHARSADELRSIAVAERDRMSELAERLRTRGIPVPTVSIGSTPTISHIDHLAGVDEIRPGNYIFFDAFQATLGSCGFGDCALTVLTSVISRDRASRKIVIDAGAIALSRDRGPVEIDAHCGYGRVLDLDGNELGLRITDLSQEHGVAKADTGTDLDRFSVGTRLRILANHSCLSAAQHSHYNVFQNSAIVDKWQIHRGW